MKILVIILVLLGLVACGNRSDLYLSDEDRLKHTKDISEIERLQLRASRYQELERETGMLQRHIVILRSQGRNNEANAAYIRYKELRYEMGKILLARQKESEYGDI